MPVVIKSKPKPKIVAHVDDINLRDLVPPEVSLDLLDKNGMPYFLVRANWVPKVA